MGSGRLSASESRIYQAILNAMGPVIRDLISDDRVIEIMLNPDGSLWVEKISEGMGLVQKDFSKSDAETLIRLVSSRCGFVCNDKSPSLSCIIPVSNARFQAFVSPAVDSPSFSIRKRATQIFTFDDYVDSGIMTEFQKDYLSKAVQERKNILVVGGTGTGKTTLVNAILHEIAKTEDRIVTIEDTAELQCSSENKVQLYCNASAGFTMQKAVCEVMRFRPDRIVVGEVRDGSALDLLKAWNTGHKGGVSTVHANSARLGLRRIESLISEVSVNIPRDLISESINILISIKRELNKRFISEVIEVSGLKDGEYQIRQVN
ncbi:MAG: P-type conjugative transfer ATPase TrbB [Deltaproteobacteria bacterium]|nr:P-type conjugative transfer ATPase TrbB [Deltaproteobacteria bacterium]